MNSPISITQITLEHLALDESELRGRLHDLEADLAVYREIATEAIHVLHDVTTDRDRLRERYHDLLNVRRAERQARAA